VWSYRWSDSLESLKRIAKVSGKMPKALIEKPELDDSVDQYIKAISYLNYFRNSDGKIPMQDMVTYGNQIGEEDVLEFIKILTIADQALLAAAREYSESKK
jgi:hypothetical protein